MRGFPEHIATRQDYENLLGMSEHKEKALEKLRELAGFDDRIVTRATKPLNPDDPMSDWEVEEIPNPYPLHDTKRYRDWETDRKSTRLNSSHRSLSRMPSSA